MMYCEKIKLTKTTNTLLLSHEISKRKPFVFLIHESGEIIKPLYVEKFSDKEIVLVETINPKLVKRGYLQQVDDRNHPFGEKIPENIYVQIFYERR